MVRIGDKFCPKCRNPLSYYDTVRRIVRKEGRKTRRLYIRRLRCVDCGRIHRELPDIIFPNKQYEAGIIRGVIQGHITPETEGFEEYPCEETMRFWRTRKLQGLLEEMKLMENYEMTDRDFAVMAMLAIVGAAAVTLTLAVTTVTATCKLANKVAGMSCNSKSLS